MLRGQRRSAAVFWSGQVDAAAVAEKETMVDGGGGAPKVRQREEEDEVKRYGGKMERPPGPIYKGKRIKGRRENRGARKMGCVTALLPQSSEAH